MPRREVSGCPPRNGHRKEGMGQCPVGGGDRGCEAHVDQPTRNQTPDQVSSSSLDPSHSLFGGVTPELRVHEEGEEAQVCTQAPFQGWIPVHLPRALLSSTCRRGAVTLPPCNYRETEAVARRVPLLPHFGGGVQEPHLHLCRAAWGFSRSFHHIQSPRVKWDSPCAERQEQTGHGGGSQLSLTPAKVLRHRQLEGTQARHRPPRTCGLLSTCLLSGSGKTICDHRKQKTQRL